MREIKNHLAEGETNSLRIEAYSEAYPAGGAHRYDIVGFDTKDNPANMSPDGYRSLQTRLTVIFQNGPVDAVGQNGVTIEAIIAIAADRLATLQQGPLACESNARALVSLYNAMHDLHGRTKERIRRGVQGTQRV